MRTVAESLGRRYPLYRGCGRLGSSAPLRALALGRERAVRLRDGSLVHVRDDEYVGRAVCFFGDLDPKISWVLRELLRPGDLFVDVGANYGVVTMQAARLVGPTGAVHAVEPQPSMASRLRRSIADNGYSNVTVHEVALSGDDGRLDMFVPAVNTGAASLTRRWNTDGTTVAVEVRAAGPFLEGISAGTTPRLVKLDVEGHEASVINAAREFLVASGVMVLFESNDDMIPFWDDETTIALLDMGYSLYALPLRNLFRPSLRPIRPGGRGPRPRLPRPHGPRLVMEQRRVMSVARGLRTFALGLFVRAVDRVMGMPAPTSPPRTEHPAPAPILVVAPAAGFARYYPELLANEGFTAVDVLGDVDAAALDGRSVVLVGEGELRPSTVATLSAWVEEGGALVCMRPDAELADVLGLAPLGSTIDNGYLRVVTDAPPGAGIVGAPLQFHGRADCWMLDGATQVAALQATADEVTDSPAVTIRRVGDRGGCAAAFAFDLARSVALTRQGNPEWAGQNRDGDLLVRSDDLFFGAAVGDPQPDWVDPTLLDIPQADEQQRLLVNLITMMTAPSLPLPRFWYLPSGKRAVVVMTGDDHGAGGTVERFERYAALDEPGASTQAWETVRATSYVTAATSRIPWRKLIRLRRAGFEIALHVDTWNEDWTPERLRHFYAHQLAWFRNRSPFAGAPRTVRTHCVAWTDYVTQPHVELEHGIRLDTNYYAYPQSWVAGRVGHFTGSALPMRFADMDGSPIDVFQAVTQITDESAQQLPRCIEEILDAALGPNAFIAVVTVQAHTDRVESGVSDAVLAAARQRGVSVIAAQQLLTWLDARNASRVDRVAWRDGRLCFDVVGDPLAHGLQLLVPAESAAGPSIVGVAVDGVPMELTNETFKGGAYARVEARTGSYEVTYGPSAALRFTTEPVVVAAAGSVEVRWTTNVPSSSIVEHGPAATTVPACVCNELAVTDHAITLEHLAPGSIVQLRVRSEAGRDAVCWPGEGRMFEVHVPPPAVCHAGSAAFADGDCEGVVVSPERGGEIVLAPARHALDGTDAWSAGSSGPLIALDGRVTFHVGGDVQRFGLGDAGDAGAAFELTPDGRLGAVTWDGAQRSRQEIPGRWAGAAHRLRIDRETPEARFWIDGSDVALVPARIGDTAEAVIEGRVEVEWLRALPYGLRGTYTSPVLDSGDGTTWRRLAWVVVHAQTTRLDVSVRVGDDAGLSDGAAPWTPVAHSGCDLPATGRYLQYRLTLTSAQPMRTPAVQSVTIERTTCSPVARLASRARTITE